MSLSTHINAEKVLKASREHSHKHGRPSIHELMSRDKPGHYDLPPVSYLAARAVAAETALGSPQRLHSAT